VDDLINGIVRMLDCTERGPINLGNPDEFAIIDFARLVLEITSSASPIEYKPLPEDDPRRRRPVISRAKERIDWEPKIPVSAGVTRTMEWLRTQLAEAPSA
jgi:nucleoside-diphosphate-sugar epimerase